MDSLVLPIALLIIGVAFVAMALSIAVRRVVRQRRIVRYELRASRLRPLMLRLLSEDDPDLSSLDSLAGADGRLVESLAWSLLPKVRGASREALARWLDKRGAVDRARRRTHRPGAVGRSRAAEHLGASGSIESSPDIIRLLGDRRLEVRIVAARALGKLGDARAVPHLLQALDGTKFVPMSLVSMALIHIGPAAIDELIKGLGSKSARSRSVCSELLGIHGAFQAARWLLLLVEHDGVDEVRVKAAIALGRLGSPNGVRPLSHALAPNQSTPLRVAAAQSLGQIGGSDALIALQHGVQDAVAEVSGASAEALANLGQRGAGVLQMVSEGEGASALRAKDWLSRKALQDSGQRQRSRVRSRAGSA